MRWPKIFLIHATLLAVQLGYSLASSAVTERFEEHLTLRPLPDGKVAATFAFTTLLSGVAPRDPDTAQIDDDAQHYTLFPLALGQILREYAVTELHLTLNAGNWNYMQWGYPQELGVGTGAEVWAWMGDSSSSSIDERWQGLRNALAGLFCASLGSLDAARTTSPSMSFPPEGSLPTWNHPNSTQHHHVRHASHTSENVCTENLTPFLKLLPCKSLSGLASLLNPHSLFAADWHGLGVHVIWDAELGVKVRLTFQSVLDPIRNGSLGSRKRDWSLESLFGRRIRTTCPVAARSRVSVKLPVGESYILTPEPTNVDSDKIAHFDSSIAEESGFSNVAMQWPEETEFRHPSSNEFPIPWTVKRALLGSSQAHGSLSLVIRNHQDSSMRVLYLETMPWLLQFYMHTLMVDVGGSTRRDLVTSLTYIPSIPHSRPTTMECVLEVPAHSTLRLTIDVTKSFLRYTDHPPDAQRGWDLPPAVLVPLSTNGTLRRVSGERRRMYTPALLVDLATPDFSMPYNVIIFSCSVVAFIFGSVFNLLTRSFVVVRLTANAGGDIAHEKEEEEHNGASEHRR